MNNKPTATPFTPTTLPRPTPEMLARRKDILRETAGIWSGPAGERIERELEEMFGRPDDDIRQVSST